MFRDWIDRMGYSQREAAEALGVSVGKINALAKGEEPGLLIQLACEALERRLAPNSYDAATACAPAPAGPYHSVYEIAPTRGDIDAIHARLAAAERTARTALQRAQEACLAIDEAGVPIRQELIPMTDEEAEEADLKIRKAQLLEQMNRDAKAAPGALTDDEREEAERARRMIAKARTLAAGEPWE